MTAERLDRVIDQPPDLLRKLEIRTEISPILSFAKKRGWTQKLDPKDLELMRTVIADYDAALHRIRVSRIKTKQMKRYGDIQKILFMRGQDRSYTPDELYGAFQDATADQIHTIREEMKKQKWQLMSDTEREAFLVEYLPYNRQEYLDIFADFRNFGFRILVDVVCDLDDIYSDEERKKNAVRTDTDSELVNDIMKHYLRGGIKDYRDLAASRARLYLNGRIDADAALKCAIALKKRDFSMDVLLDRIEANAVKGW